MCVDDKILRILLQIENRVGIYKIKQEGRNVIEHNLTNIIYFDAKIY